MILNKLLPAALAILSSLPLTAAPGAHGPNGEHLDAPASAGGGTVLPRMEANTDLFELVAELKDGALHIHLDRYASNEPVIQAAIELESGELKAKAAYQAAEGYYLLNAPELVKRLATPAEHTLVFTIVADSESDLLNGVLDTRNALAEHGHGHSPALEWTLWGLGALLMLSLLVFGLRRRQRKLKTGELQ